jgi:hypothetical protein
VIAPVEKTGTIVYRIDGTWAHRFTLDFSPEGLQSFQGLCQKADLPEDPSKVIASALMLYDYVLRKQNEGSELALVSKDGTAKVINIKL